jgi:uncharacterized membrane protein YdjX (TVP38/TMEM64 family)
MDMTPKRLLAMVGFPLLLTAIFAPLIIFRREVWDFFTSIKNIREWVSERGAIAPMVFVAVQALQVIVFVIPGEVPEVAGGYLFGVWAGLLLSMLGILLGSAVGFFLSRLLGVPFVRAIVPKEQFDKMEKLLNSPRSKIVFFLLFLIPAIPKDFLCYVAGLSPMGFPFFIAISFLGRLPALFGSTMIGSAWAENRWVLAGIIFAVVAVLFGVGYLLRDRVGKLIERISTKKKREPEDGG